MAASLRRGRRQVLHVVALALSIDRRNIARARQTSCWSLRYFQWKEQKPYHIDYCFIPEEWAPDVQCVEIGSYAEWKDYSDHRPLLVEVADRPKESTFLVSQQGRNSPRARIEKGRLWPGEKLAGPGVQT
jgi:hypothetical protein